MEIKHCQVAIEAHRRNGRVKRSISLLRECILKMMIEYLRKSYEKY